MIGTLQRYVLRETFKVFLLATVAVSAVLSVSFCVRLLNRGMDLGSQLLDVLPYVFLFTLPFAVPCGILIASVLTFGRLTGENEILAAQAHGISRWHLVTPVLLLGLALTTASAYLNANVLPLGEYRVRRLGKRTLASMLGKLGTWVQELDVSPYVVYVSGKDPDNPRQWRNVVVVRFADRFIAEIYSAARGSYALDEHAGQAVIDLRDVYIIRPELGEDVSSEPASAAGHGAWSQTDRFQLRVPLDESEDAGPTKRHELPWDMLCARYWQYRIRTEGRPRIKSPRAERRRLKRDLIKLRHDRDTLIGERADLSARTAEARRNTQVQRANVEAGLKRHSRLKGGISDLEIRRARLLGERKEWADWLERETDPKRKALHRARLDAIGRQAAAADAELARLRRERDAYLMLVERSRQALLGEEQALKAAGARMIEVAGQIDRARWAVAGAESARQAAYDQEMLIIMISEIHYRLAQSAASVVFLLIGIPLGMLIHRGSAVIAFGASLAVVLVLYYPLYNLGRMMAVNAYLPPAPAYWMAPAACALVGLALFAVVARR